MAEYVQAWEIKSSTFSGIVYDQNIAMNKWADTDDAEMYSMTIVRHDDGSREYLRRTVADEVQKYRESL